MTAPFGTALVPPTCRVSILEPTLSWSYSSVRLIMIIQKVDNSVEKTCDDHHDIIMQSTRITKSVSQRGSANWDRINPTSGPNP